MPYESAAKAPPPASGISVSTRYAGPAGASRLSNNAAPPTTHPTALELDALAETVGEQPETVLADAG